MTWTYTGDLPTDPATATTAQKRDWIRVAVGDTVSTNPLATDETIASALAETIASGGTVTWALLYMAAATVADRIAAVFPAQKANKLTMGKTSVEYASNGESFRSLAIELRQRGRSKVTLTPFFGGVSTAANQTAAADTSIVQPRAYSGQDGYPGTLPALDTSELASP